MRQVAVLPILNQREQRGVTTSHMQQELLLQYSFKTAKKVSPDRRRSTYMTFGMLPVRLARQCLKQVRCGIIKEWMKGVRNHVYWCTSSTNQGFENLILAKWIEANNETCSQVNIEITQILSSQSVLMWMRLKQGSGLKLVYLINGGS